MKADILRRVRKLESTYTDGTGNQLAIVVRPVDSSASAQPIPIYGFKEVMCTNPVTVWRLPDENDDQLEARAINEARNKPGRDQRATPSLFAIIEPKE